MKPNETGFITQSSSTSKKTQCIPVDQNKAKSAHISPVAKWLVHKVMVSLGSPEIFIVLPDGATTYLTADQPDVGMVICNRKSLWRFITNPRLYFGEEFAKGNIQIEGDLVEFIMAAYKHRPQLHEKSHMGRAISKARRYQRNNSIGNARSNIQHHYDVGNDFFKLWLDKDLVYTCAYFPEPDVTLEQAQFAKLDYVCRKLRLQSGETVVEAGCGWGALALHMAKYFGVKVKAYNISHQQIVEANARVNKLGLQDQVEFIEDDYRNITGCYDAFVSVGMLEHVGKSCYQSFGEVIDRCLAEKGRGLIHSIGQNEADPMDPWALKHIFPGAYLPTLREMMDALEPYGFAVLDVENLRLHYAQTLRHWLKRFDNHEAEIRNMYDDNFVRTWRLYLAGAIANFSLGDTDLFQVVFTHPANNEIPLTRAYLYSDDSNKDRDSKAWKRATS